MDSRSKSRITVVSPAKSSSEKKENDPQPTIDLSTTTATTSTLDAKLPEGGSESARVPNTSLDTDLLGETKNEMLEGKPETCREPSTQTTTEREGIGDTPALATLPLPEEERAKLSDIRGKQGSFGFMGIFRKSSKDIVDDVKKEKKKEVKTKEKEKEKGKENAKGKGKNKDDDDKRNREEEIIVALSFDELPETLQSEFQNAHISNEELKDPANWNIIRHIASFRLYKRIVQPDYQHNPQPPSEILCLGMTVNQCEEKYLIKDVEPNLKKTYKNLSQCGRGGFGRVFSTQSTLDKGKVALKKIKHATEKDKRHNLLEIVFLSACNHPNIVKYLRTHQINEELWIAMEFMEGGTLNDTVKVSALDEFQIAFIAREMTSAIQYLHERNWAHRDLKSSNVMITVGGDVKLIDFGLCVDLSEGPDTHMCGSPYWMPPEMIRKEPHGLLVDIWSLGICLLELANTRPPNHKNPIKAMFTAGTVGIEEPFERPDRWSVVFRNFVSMCLVFDTTKRATADQLSSHEFLKAAAPKKVMEKVFSRMFLTAAITKVY
eukprot:TRINITY_DN12946_c0_g1_i1.p1 TRINITY_DN12946_c0_g1~~TRINITY_DN12946_c0_g1_i1.p1  ORF type:complete len:619 (-),score=119.81 TRINITY_DN12946_c0_g1_i1:250-1893(-)